MSKIARPDSPSERESLEQIAWELQQLRRMLVGMFIAALVIALLIAAPAIW